MKLPGLLTLTLLTTTASPKVEEALIGIISKSFKNDKVFEVVGIKFGLVKSAIFCHFSAQTFTATSAITTSLIGVFSFLL